MLKQWSSQIKFEYEARRFNNAVTLGVKAIATIIEDILNLPSNKRQSPDDFNLNIDILFCKLFELGLAKSYASNIKLFLRHFGIFLYHSDGKLYNYKKCNLYLIRNIGFLPDIFGYFTISIIELERIEFLRHYCNLVQMIFPLFILSDLINNKSQWNTEKVLVSSIIKLCQSISSKSYLGTDIDKSQDYLNICSDLWQICLNIWIQYFGARIQYTNISQIKNSHMNDLDTQVCVINLFIDMLKHLRDLICIISKSNLEIRWQIEIVYRIWIHIFYNQYILFKLEDEFNWSKTYMQELLEQTLESPFLSNTAQAIYNIILHLMKGFSKLNDKHINFDLVIQFISQFNSLINLMIGITHKYIKHLNKSIDMEDELFLFNRKDKLELGNNKYFKYFSCLLSIKLRLSSLEEIHCFKLWLCLSSSLLLDKLAGKIKELNIKNFSKLGPLYESMVYLIIGVLSSSSNLNYEDIYTLIILNYLISSQKNYLDSGLLRLNSKESCLNFCRNFNALRINCTGFIVKPALKKSESIQDIQNDKLKLKWDITFKLVCILEKSISLIESCGDFIINSFNSSNIKLGELAIDTNSITRSEEDKENDDSLNLLSNNILNTSFKARLCSTEILIRLIRYRGYDNEEIRKIYEFLDGVSKYRYFQKMENQYLADELRFNFFLVLSDNLIRLASQLRSSKNYKDASRIARLALDTLTPILNIPWISSKDKMLRVNKNGKIGSLDFDPTLEVQNGELISTPTRDSNFLKLQLTAGFKDEYLTQETFSRFWISDEGKSSINRSSMHEYFNGTRATNQTLMTPFTSRLYSKGLSTVRSQTIRKIQKYTMSSFRFKKNQGYDITLDEYKEDEEASSFICPIHVLLFLLALEQESSALAAYCDSELKDENNKDEKLQKYFEILTNIEDCLSLIFHSVDDYTRWFLIYFIICNKILGIDKLVKKFYLEIDYLKFNLNYVLMDSISNPFIGVLKSLASRYIKSKLEILQLNPEHYPDIINRFPQFNSFNFFEFIWIRLELYFYSYYRHGSTIMYADNNKEDNSKVFLNHKYSDVYIKGINNGFCSGLISLYNITLDKFKPNGEDILDSFIYCDMKLCLYYFLIWIHRIIIFKKIKRNILLPFDSCLEVAIGILNKIESHLLDVFEASECEEIVKSQLYLYLGKINMLKAKTMMESTSSISDFWWKSSLNSSRQSCEYISVSFDLLNSFNILCTKTESIMNSEGLISMNTSVWKEHFFTGNENLELASNSYTDEYDSLDINNLGIPKPLCSVTTDYQSEKDQNENFFTPKRLTTPKNRDTAISFKTPGRVRFEEASGDKSKSIMSNNMQLARTHSVVRFQIDSFESDNEDNIRKDEKSFIEQSSIFNNAITFEMLEIYLHCILESISLCELLNYQQGVIKHLSLVLSLLSSCWIFCIEGIKYDELKSVEKIANIIDFNTKSFVENNLMRNFNIQSFSDLILSMQFEVASVISICLYRFTALTTGTSYNNHWKQICTIFHKGFLYFLQNHPSLSKSFGNQQGIYSSHTFCFEILLQLQLYRLEICNDLDWKNIVDCLNSIKEMFADIQNKKTTANIDFFKESTEDSLYKKSLCFCNDSSSNILQDSLGPFRFNVENRLNCLVTLCRVYKKLSRYFLTSNKPDIALFYILEANKIIQTLPKKSIPFFDLAKSNKLVMESTNYLYKIKFSSCHNILGKLIMEDYSNSFINSKNLAIEQLCTLGEYWWKCGVIERCFGIYEKALDICTEWTNSYYKAVNIVYNQLSFLLTSSIGRCNPQYNLYYSVNKLIEEKKKSTYSEGMVDKQLEGDICSEDNIIEPRNTLFDEADEDIYQTTDENNNKSLKNINKILNLVFSPISDLIKSKNKDKIKASRTESLHLNNIFQKLLNILVYCLLYFQISRNNTDDTKVFFDSIKKYSKIIFEILGKLEQENSWLYLFQKQCIQKLSSKSTKPTSKYKYQYLLDMITSNFSMLDNNINFISDIAICFVLDLSHNCIQLAPSLKNTTLENEKDEDTILFLAYSPAEDFSNINNEYFDVDFRDLILSELDKVWSIIGFFSKDDQIKDNVLPTKNRKSKQKKLIKEIIGTEKNEKNSSSTKYNIYDKNVNANDKNHDLINCNIKANIINSLHFTTFTLQLCHKVKNFQYINICISCILDILLCLHWLTRYYHIPKVLETIKILTPLSCSVQSCYIVYCMRIFQKLFNQLQENFEESSSFEVEYRNTFNCLLKSFTLSSWNFSRTIFDLNDINSAWSSIFIRLSTFTCRFRGNKVDSKISKYSLKSTIDKQNPNEYVIVQISRLLIGSSLFSDKYITGLLEFRNQEIKTKSTNEYSRYPSLSKSSETTANSTFTKPLFTVVRRIHYKTLESLLEEYEQIQKENLASIVTNEPIDNNQLSKKCLPNYSHKLYVNKWWLRRKNIQDQLKIWLTKFEAFIFNKWNFLLHGWPKYFNYENLVDTINNQYIISSKESLFTNNSKSSEVRKSNRSAKNTSNILNTTDLITYNINGEEKALIEISILILITKSCNLGIDIMKILLRYFNIKDQIKTFLLDKLPLIIQKISNLKLNQENKKSNKVTKNEVNNSWLIKQLPNPIILYLDPLFMNLPLEGLECNIVQPITRGVHPSISLSNLRHFKSKLKHENSPYTIFSCKQCNLFYCINPTGDLIQTENLIVPYLKSIFRFSNHSGISNFIPNPKDVLTNMSNEKSNLYLFCGHQAGEKFLPGEAFEKGILSTRENFDFINAKSNQIQVYNLPPALLIGCSSSRMRSYGSNECFCTPFHYLIGGSPFVLGILWDVTDHDIDLFTISIFEIWSNYKYEHSLSLLDAITISRNKCKLQLLNGNSCICFGFPV